MISALSSLFKELELSWKYKFRLINPLIVFALALLLRLINVLAIGRDYYANLLSDASTYRLWATRLAAGLSFGDPAFQMGPLYPYFMAINLNFGIDFYGMLFLQAFLGGVTAICIYFIARKLFFSDSAGLISGILTALFSPFIFYDGLILSESLQLTFISISLLLLLYTDNNKFFTLKVIISEKRILIGLASLGRATVLIFVLCILIYWLLKWVVSSKNVKTTLVKTALIYLAGCFIGIFPATLHNLLNNELVLISTNSGINLYIGNNSRANGTYEEPPGLNLSTDFTGRKIAERISNRPLRVLRFQISG